MSVDSQTGNENWQPRLGGRMVAVVNVHDFRGWNDAVGDEVFGTPTLKAAY